MPVSSCVGRSILRFPTTAHHALMQRIQRIHHDTIPENVLTIEDTLSLWLHVFHLMRSLFINGSNGAGISRDPILSTFIIPVVIEARRQTNKMKWPESDVSSRVVSLYSLEQGKHRNCYLRYQIACSEHCVSIVECAERTQPSFWGHRGWSHFFRIFLLRPNGFPFFYFYASPTELSTWECVCNT